MRSKNGLLFPRLPAVASRDAAGLKVVDFSTGTSLHADGALGQALWTALSSGEPGPLLRCLGEAHPACQFLARARTGPSLPLTAAASLRLEGFGTLFLELTARCNERCQHCYAGAGPTATAALSETECLQVLEDVRRLGVERLQLTGGEPLLCSFLARLLAEARALGIANVEIFSNGTLLDDARLEELAPFRPTFAFSVYSNDAAAHDAITGMRGSHARTVAAIERVLARGLEARAAVVAMEQNEGQVAETVAFLRVRGLKHVSASPSHAVGRGSFLSNWNCPIERPADESPAPDLRELGTLCVAADGAVYPCPFNRTQRLGSIRERRLAAIVEAPDLTALTGGEDLEGLRARLQCRDCQATAHALQSCERARGE